MSTLSANKMAAPVSSCVTLCHMMHDASATIGEGPSCHVTTGGTKGEREGTAEVQARLDLTRHL